MSDWQRGDLALCVDDKPSPLLGRHPAIKGRIYTVASVVIADSLGLTFEEIDHPNALGYYAHRFRKVTPPKADEFDREVIDLMNRKPVEV
ncbi:hypothetical protein GRI72_02850 [Altererythrobacter marinus]|uniref:Uncharacterized protein n=1 Tax=Pelagerythrobacter marinus TaxID=538382 RepID=A0ABW9USD7_9SPHN|nr:hypothetical protein [Pelagerythrobacter marinus]MXO67771.1 hypothetical protein [Pelagerythrobacter marinus]